MPHSLAPSVTSRRYLCAGISLLLLGACSNTATRTAPSQGATGSGGSNQAPPPGGVAPVGGLTGGAGAASGGTVGAGGGQGAGGAVTTGGAVASGGEESTGGSVGSGGAQSTGGAVATGGTQGTGGAGEDALAECDDSSLDWRSAKKTNYTSYPDAGSVECIEYSGCMWAGYFAGCDSKQSEQWVETHNIVAAFPDFAGLAHHRLCLRSGDSRIIVHVVDTCGDSDCSGCCTRNKGTAEELIDLESYTNERWGVEDGSIEWADLGPATPICE